MLTLALKIKRNVFQGFVFERSSFDRFVVLGNVNLMRLLDVYLEGGLLGGWRSLRYFCRAVSWQSRRAGRPVPARPGPSGEAPLLGARSSCSDRPRPATCACLPPKVSPDPTIAMDSLDVDFYVRHHHKVQGFLDGQ